MVSRSRIAPQLIDRYLRLADRKRPGFDPNFVCVHLLNVHCVEHLGPGIRCLNPAAIADLPASLCIKRSAVQDNHALFPFFQRIDVPAVTNQSEYVGSNAFLLIPYECGIRKCRVRFFVFAPPVSVVHFSGCARHVSLLVHPPVETFFVDGAPLFLCDFPRQLRRKSIRIV